MNARKIKKNMNLTPDEIAFEKEIEAGQWTEASKDLKRKIVASAKNSVARKNREARVNIRMTSETLELIQDLAEQEGVGYQTLMGSVIHKYAHGLFVSTNDLKKVVTSMGLKKSK